MQVIIVEQDSGTRLIEELKSSGVDAVGVNRTDLIKGELGTVDSGIMFVDVTRVSTPKPVKPRVQPSYRSLLKKIY